MQEVTQEKERIISDNYAQIEDDAMKTAAMFWGDELLGWLGVKEKLKYIAPTESVHLELRKMYEDFNYALEDGSWIHLEFESDSIKKEDLKRFREYEAVTSRTFGVAVTTYVICSSKVKKLLNQFTEGINTYRVHVIRMKNDSVEEVFKQFAQQEVKDRNAYIPIILSPLMAGEMSQKERILKGIGILRNSEAALEADDSRKMQAVMYAFANKFLTKMELKEVKEAIVMTTLGQMIYEDGVEEGMEKGIQGTIISLQEEGIPRERVLDKLKLRFSLPEEKAQEYLDKYWK